MKSTVKLLCARCEKIVEPVITTSGPHYKANCPDCGKYIKFVPANMISDTDVPDGRGLKNLTSETVKDLAGYNEHADTIAEWIGEVKPDA
jgi:DNA-directed RNA polymerase subunit RPC12/RpoP